MTQIETIIDEIERLNADIDSCITKLIKARGEHNDIAIANAQHEMESLMVKTMQVCSFIINSLPAEQPSEELEKAATALANEIVGELNVGDYTDHSGHNAYWHSFKEGVVAGADWQKEQMIKSAIDAKIVNDEMSGCVVDCKQGCLVLEPHRYPIGQKLKILILEEDK